jgi:hypothetical protein
LKKVEDKDREIAKLHELLEKSFKQVTVEGIMTASQLEAKTKQLAKSTIAPATTSNSKKSRRHPSSSSSSTRNSNDAARIATSELGTLLPNGFPPPSPPPPPPAHTPLLNSTSDTSHHDELSAHNLTDSRLLPRVATHHQQQHNKHKTNDHHHHHHYDEDEDDEDSFHDNHNHNHHPLPSGSAFGFTSDTNDDNTIVGGSVDDLSSIAEAQSASDTGHDSKPRRGNRKES